METSTGRAGAGAPGAQARPSQEAGGPLPHPAAGHAAGWHQARRGALAAGAGVFAASAAVLAAVELVSAGQRSMLDLRIYRWAGLVAGHSGDLYGSHFPHYHLLFTYPPMAALVFAGMSVIPLAVLKWLMTAGSVAVLTGVIWLTWGMLGHQRSAGRLAATLAVAGVALWLGPVQQTIGYGQVNLFLMLVIVADLRLPDHARAKGIGLGLAAGFKLTPLIFIGYLLLTRRIRAACVALATFALTIAGSFLLLPSQSGRFWLGGLYLDSSRTGNIAYVSNQSIDATLTRLLGSPPAAQPYWLATSAAVGVAGLLLAAHLSRRGQEMTGILACALTGLLICPVSWSHHWVWAAPALVAAIEAAGRPAGPGRGILPGRDRVRNPDRDRGPEPSPARPARAAALRWGRRLGLMAAIAPFFLLPQNLVPASVVQGAGAAGAQLLTSNLYVIAGIALLMLGGLLLAARGRRPGG